jgi:AraC family transcriptional regulator
MGMNGDNFVRLVGGNVVSSRMINTASLRIEKIRRQFNGNWHWHFRQPELCLFNFGNGTERLRATIDGRPVSYGVTGRSRLCIFPARTEIKGEWSAGPTAEYTVVFLNADFISARLHAGISNPVVGFEHDGLARGLAELCREAESPDNIFELLAEGWSIQALAHMARISRKEGRPKPATQGGFSGHSAKLLDEYIRARLSEEITLQSLAVLVGLSKRHFQRAFQDSFQTTPHRYILSLRIEEAKKHLGHSDESITEIALSAGFGQVEHFSTTFKKITGFTPSQFRQQNLA